MHKQHPQTAYRKYAVSIGTIFENCDKQNRSVGESLRGGFCMHKAAQQGREKALFLPKNV